MITLMTFHLKRFVDKHLMYLQHKFKLRSLTCWSVTIIFINRFFLVRSDNNFKQRCAIRFCFKLGHSATDTFQKLQQAYGESVLSRAEVFRWFKAFSGRREKKGRMSKSKIKSMLICFFDGQGIVHK